MLCRRLEAIAYAAKAKEIVELPPKRLYHSFLEFAEQLKAGAVDGSVPASVSGVVYAFAYQIRVTVFEIDSLRNAIDRLQEAKEASDRVPYIPLFSLYGIRKRDAKPRFYDDDDDLETV
jgi:hypothetical protein